MKYFLSLVLIASFSGPVVADEYGTNFSDDLDKNVVPSSLEEREEEEVNLTDPMDENFVPAEEEERAQQEEVESDILQKDDPEKAYDPLDEELDE